MTVAEREIPISIQGSLILCIIDLSEESKEVVQTAINIAGASKSTLTVLYPYRLNQPRSVATAGEWKKSIDADASTSFARMTAAMLRDTGITCEFKPEVGFMNDRVEAFIRKHHVGMLVIGRQFGIENKDAFTDMLEKIECPVLIIPNNKKQ